MSVYLAHCLFYGKKKECVLFVHILVVSVSAKRMREDLLRTKERQI